MRTLVVVFVVLVLGCGEDTASVAGAEVVADSGSDSDASRDGAVATTEDASLPEAVVDVGVETFADVATEAFADSASETVADTALETAPPADATEVADSGSETTIGGPQGQCGDSSDCPGVLFCAASAPGGICNGCSGNDPCPADLWCNEFGSCSRDCETRADCPQGMRCHPSLTVCTLESCSDDNDCEAPYLCDVGSCRRPECGDDGVCPIPLVCVVGMCLEPYWVD